MNRGCGCSGGCETCGGARGGCEGDTRWIQIAVVILIIFLIYRYGMEHYVGNGLGTPAGTVGAYTSGATLRRLGQQFTSTNQGVPLTLYNADLPGQDRAIHVVVYPDGGESSSGAI